ncbi:helix-turn-helix domain-containing protein [Kibdelosporangium phytohabitans]|uniref:helix-turn-helix domain-containing protein n=1 Tax=Kibdelosporangium phytohabitans TaxID=860235 RepID=UPI0019F1100C|nr:helix-turn-helix transcriptional regulator [Kibdelosporangium phytohabitans]MBE1462387.1 transcriptional regulator with XRE-family HTH domain [Kibdelosporangium phytohabitans]
MPKNTGSTFLRRKLGAKLRRLREEAGWTLGEAAAELDKTRSASQRIESGETRADAHLVRTTMDKYDEDLVRPHYRRSNSASLRWRAALRR